MVSGPTVDRVVMVIAARAATATVAPVVMVGAMAAGIVVASGANAVRAVRPSRRVMVACRPS